MFSEVAIETSYVQLWGLGPISPQRTLSSSEMLSTKSGMMAFRLGCGGAQCTKPRSVRKLCLCSDAWLCVVHSGEVRFTSGCTTFFQQSIWARSLPHPLTDPFLNGSRRKGKAGGEPQGWDLGGTRRALISITVAKVDKEPKPNGSWSDQPRIERTSGEEGSTSRLHPSTLRTWLGTLVAWYLIRRELKSFGQHLLGAPS